MACGPHSLASVLIISLSVLSFVSAMSSPSCKWMCRGWDFGSGGAQAHPPFPWDIWTSQLAGTEVVWEAWECLPPSPSATLCSAVPSLAKSVYSPGECILALPGTQLLVSSPKYCSGKRQFVSTHPWFHKREMTSI